MKRAVLAGILVVALHGTAGAQGPIPDPWAPSNYTIVPGPAGTNALGYDAYHWSYWHTQIDPRGNMYGYDDRGNYWTYSRRTNSYQYYGTDPRWQHRCYSSSAAFC